VVVDTNLWVRILLGGPISQPVLQAWRDGRVDILISDLLLEELEQVCRRPRLAQRIAEQDLIDLLELLRHRAVQVVVTTTPPACRDPRDQPVLATAIDGGASAIITGDADLRADESLRQAMTAYAVKIWGVTALRDHLAAPSPGDA
jgi:putative PIN family toxin of toxin-antitoxin system